MVSTDYKVIFLEVLAVQMVSDAVRLRAAIVALAAARIESTKSGLELIGTAANGHSVTFTPPAAGRGLTQHQIVEMLGGFLRLHDAAKAYLVEDGNTDPSDDLILSEMISRLAAPVEVGVDFSGWRRGGQLA